MSVKERNIRILEIGAVIFNLLFTVLYLNGNRWCYLFGILGPLLLFVLCIKKKLYAEPVLQLFYIAFAVYGLFNASDTWTMVSWTFQAHLPYIIAGILLSVVSGYFLKMHTGAQLPYPDSVVTVFGIMGTWVMVNYVHENWLYFIVINTLSIYIYLRRKLFIGAAMYVLYLLMAIDGYLQLKIFFS